jgi:hypothetical protein
MDKADKRIVFHDGPVNPEHIIEQEIIMVRRCQPPQTEIRAVHHDLAKFSNLGKYS